MLFFQFVTVITIKEMLQLQFETSLSTYRGKNVQATPTPQTVIGTLATPPSQAEADITAKSNSTVGIL
jgi:hypothetical protein